MTRTAGRGAGARRHLDLGRILDLLEDRLDPAAARAAEEHLATPCEACRERVREAALLVEHMRQDRVPAVPAALRARALEVFAPQPAPRRARGLAERLAELLFDSLSAPLPAAARRAVGASRRLRFALGEGTLELEIEREDRATVSLRGWLGLDDPALHRLEVRAGAARVAAWPDAAGRFAFERLPAGPLTLSVTGPAGRFRVPAFEP